MRIELSPENEKLLAETPKIKAMAEALIAKDGGMHFLAVREYLSYKEKINREKDEEKRQLLINQASEVMALMSSALGLHAEDIVKDAEELAKVGIAELAALRGGAPLADGPETLQ